MKKEIILRNLLEEIKRNNLSVFVGAGLSKGAGYPDWKELASEIGEELGLDVKKETDLIAIVQYAYNNKKKNRNFINELIRNKFLDDSKISKDMDILSRLPIRYYWTTNYDLLIERTFKKINKVVDVKIVHDDLSNNIYNRDVVLYKIHGDARNPNDAVLTRDDYEEFSEKRGFFIDKLIGELVSSTFLFIGYSFSDPNFERILSKIRIKLSNNSRTHYYFVKSISRKECTSDEDFDYQKIKQELQIQDLSYYNLEPIIVDEFSEISNFLIELEYRLKINNVFISGSAFEYGAQWDINKAKTFTQSLSERLVQNGNKIISGYGIGIGGFVIEGVSLAIDPTKQVVSDHFELHPFPQKIEEDEDSQEIWRGHREKIIGMSNFAIFVFGNKIVNGKVKEANGVYNEFEIADKLGLTIIPIASTSLAAQGIMKIVSENLDKYSYLEEYIEILCNELDIDKIINIIIEIINKEA
ncbi:MAG: SIR2 family protein [Candidatus Cloacimonetes bacterium]|nr:SIR2 family protein [Candidatus Cloacimonadota bacterium]